MNKLKTSDKNIIEINDIDRDTWYRFHFMTPLGGGKCWMKKSDNTLFICDRPDNAVRVLNAVEYIAIQAMKHFNIEPDDLTVFDYLPDVDQYDQVLFGDGYEPIFKRVKKEELSMSA